MIDKTMIQGYIKNKVGKFQDYRGQYLQTRLIVHSIMIKIKINKNKIKITKIKSHLVRINKVKMYK